MRPRMFRGPKWRPFRRWIDTIFGISVIVTVPKCSLGNGSLVADLGSEHMWSIGGWGGSFKVGHVQSGAKGYQCW